MGKNITIWKIILLSIVYHAFYPHEQIDNNKKKQLKIFSKKAKYTQFPSVLFPRDQKGNFLEYNSVGKVFMPIENYVL